MTHRAIDDGIDWPGQVSEFSECLPEYDDIPCGACSIDPDGGDRLTDEAMRACYIDGYRQLGYPVHEV